MPPMIQLLWFRVQVKITFIGGREAKPRYAYNYYSRGADKSSAQEFVSMLGKKKKTNLVEVIHRPPNAQDFKSS